MDCLLLWHMENKCLKCLKKADLPEEEEEEEKAAARRSSEEEVAAALGTEVAEGGKELYCFLGRRGMCSTSLRKVLLDTASTKAIMYGA
jgi:hypothetical protein